ncbi:hypothetical protein [Cellvibrio sp. NN19]|uniref:hypothetical protein n=1 Tax=Cellvibrio chitinivorans TaxID=3102792 RepID=UPI002B40747D|nr:hypothetical protein [Cellvibrio sp. NN19]
MAEIPKPSMQPSMGGEDNPEFMAKFYGCVAYLNRQFLICIVLLVVVALIFLSLNLIPCLRPNEIAVASWFERSGALLGAIALVVEFRIPKMETAIYRASMMFKPALYAKVSAYENHVTWLHRGALLYGVIGTLIWSYGEPILNIFWL